MRDSTEISLAEFTLSGAEGLRMEADDNVSSLRGRQILRFAQDDAGFDRGGGRLSRRP